MDCAKRLALKPAKRHNASDYVQSRQRRVEFKKYMQVKIFTIGLFSTDEQQDEFNHFLRSHKIIEVRKELAMADGNSVWTFVVTYVEGGKPELISQNGRRQKKVDYKTVLNESQFQRFTAMRVLRKQIAESEAVPAYFVFTDAELSEMAKIEPPLTRNAVSKIEGIGKAKLEKYADTFCNMDFTVIQDEKGGSSD